MKRLKYEAFFITPDDKLIPVPLFYNHIDVICDHPEWFGFTEKYVSSVFLKFNEPWKSEKKARMELMKELYRKGYIRLRFKTNYYWIAESDGIYENDKMKKQVYGWAKFMLAHEELYAKESMGVEFKDIQNMDFNYGAVWETDNAPTLKEFAEKEGTEVSLFRGINEKE